MLSPANQHESVVAAIDVTFVREQILLSNISGQVNMSFLKIYNTRPDLVASSLHIRHFVYVNTT